uniref:Uncharacterized protein n=1 Tax=Avena sativa TaxID=4498 RepID=A0ACD5YY68_AVESA
MEVAVSLAGSLLSAAVPKLMEVINEEGGKLKVDARSIEFELKLIQATLLGSFGIGRDIIGSSLQDECIKLLRRLADDIEDCIDRYHVTKTSRRKFAREIAELKRTSQETLSRMESYIRLEAYIPHPGIAAPPPPADGDAYSHVDGLLRDLLSSYDSKSRSAIFNCLLYFCMFPRDHPARRNPLIRRWLSEGLVQRENDAVKNLEALIEGKLIESVQASNNGKAKRCQPHDGVMDYISDQSMSQNFMLSCNDDDDAAQQAVEYVRRLSLHPATANGVGWLTFPENVSHLRTLAVFPPANYVAAAAANFNIDRFEVLRVLDLKECSHLGEDHLRAICDLLLLKYLSFGGSVGRVPRKIKQLQCLETLDMRRSKTVIMYAEVIQLPKLKHLLGKFKLSRWDAKFGMERLRRFLTEHSNLETFTGFVTGETRGFAELLRHMKRLRKVKTWCDSTANAANLTHLLEAVREFIRDGNQNPLVPRSLSIDFQECSLPFPDTLQAPGALASLELCGNLSRFPDLVTQLNSIDELCLSSTSLTGDTILDGLRNLLTLRYLKLTEDDLGPLEIRAGHLPGLQRICLVGVRSLDIKIQDGALPRLVSLHLLCPALHLLPGTPGDIEIAHMAGLKQVGLHSGVEDAIRDEWEAAATGHPNVPVLSSIPNP